MDEISGGPSGLKRGGTLRSRGWGEDLDGKKLGTLTEKKILRILTQEKRPKGVKIQEGKSQIA